MQEVRKKCLFWRVVIFLKNGEYRKRLNHTGNEKDLARHHQNKRGSVTIKTSDPDPYGKFLASRLRIRILKSTGKKIKKNLYFYSFVIMLTLFSLKTGVNVPVPKVGTGK
jgi:hypothetical protein